MIARILPPHEWPRLAETGCCVDQTWQARATRGYVVSVEIGRRIIATAFVFLADDEYPHVDGLWIDAPFRRKIRVQRSLHRGLTWAIARLGGGTVSIVGIPWMRRRADGFVQF